MSKLVELENSLKEIKEKLQKLEDIEDIKKLKARYAAYCDNKYNPEDMMDIFTEDAVWDGGKAYGVHEGRRSIYDFFKQVSGGIVFAVHYFTNPNIVTDGNKARARWYMWMAATFQGNNAYWLSGYEDDEYIKVDGRWWQNHMKLTVLFQTPYEAGWHKKNEASK